MRMLPSLLLAVSLFAAGPAAAISFQLLPGCGSCNGVTGSLDIVDNGGTFSVTLTLDSSGYLGSKDGFNQVGFGAIAGWSSVSLDSSPGTTTTAWSAPVEANTSAAGICTTGTSSDKVCTGGFADFGQGDVHVWKFTVTGGTLKQDEWHIGAQFADGPGRSAGSIISEEGTPGPSIPEPSAAVVFGLCAMVVARTSRRR
jgi:hypothetical protein